MSDSPTQRLREAVEQVQHNATVMADDRRHDDDRDDACRDNAIHAVILARFALEVLELSASRRVIVPEHIDACAARALERDEGEISRILNEHDLGIQSGDHD